MHCWLANGYTPWITTCGIWIDIVLIFSFWILLRTYYHSDIVQFEFLTGRYWIVFFGIHTNGMVFSVGQITLLSFSNLEFATNSCAQESKEVSSGSIDLLKLSGKVSSWNTSLLRAPEKPAVGAKILRGGNSWKVHWGGGLSLESSPANSGLEASTWSGEGEVINIPLSLVKVGIGGEQRRNQEFRFRFRQCRYRNFWQEKARQFVILWIDLRE